MQISLFENTWNIVPQKSVGYKSVLKTIQSDRFKEQVELIRSLKKAGDAQYKEEKKKLMAVTWSGTFSERAASKIIDYSGLLCVDIDDLTEEKINELKTKFKNDNCILGGFVSPSGDGLKVLLWSPDCSVKYHQHFYFSAERYFKDEYDVDIDRSCKDVCRLCYVSFDDSTWIRESVESFKVDFTIRPESNIIANTYASSGTAIGQDHQRCFKVARSWVERIYMFEEGQRNKYIHNLACSLNRLGVPLDVCIEIIKNNYVTPDKKWHQSVGSAYKHNSAQFGTVLLKDFDPKSQEAIPYVEKPFKFGDIEKEIRRIIVRIIEKNFPTDVIKSVVETYLLVYRNFFDKHILEEYGIKGVVDALINDAMNEFKDNELAGATPLASSSLLDVGKEIKDTLSRPSEFISGIDGLDDEIPGILSRGNFIGIIGREGTYKSVIAQNLAYANSKNGVYGLFLNGEMSKIQFIKRNILIDSGLNFDRYLSNKEPIPDDIYETAINSLETSVGDKLQLHTGRDFSRKQISDLIKKMRREGKDVGYVIVDGLSQFEDSKDDEIRSAIHNAGVLKELAKEMNVLVMALQHVKTGFSKTLRDTAEGARGGNKTVSNMDSYFSTSLFEVLSADSDKEVEYQKGVFCLRIADKRGGMDTVLKVINVNQLRLSVSDKQMSDFEF